MAIRRCGVCKRAPREDDGFRLLRIKKGDRSNTKIGLYAACSECYEDHRKAITKNRPKYVEYTQTKPDGSIKKKRRRKKAAELTDRDML